MGTAPKPPMNVSLYQAAAAMNNSSRWQEMITENLAASSVPGFKKQDISFEAVQSGLYPVRNSNNPLGSPMLLPSSVASTNFQQGDLRRNESRTSLALQGPGFFQAIGPQGKPVFTRDGEFRVDAKGQLVTKEGYAVAGDNGPIQLDTRSGDAIVIKPTGEVMQGNINRGKLAVVEFNDPNQLTRISAGYFTHPDPASVSHAATDTSVYQGFLEGANTSSVLEMASLLTAMRGFESNQRLIQMHDDRMGRAIQELGSPA